MAQNKIYRPQRTYCRVCKKNNITLIETAIKRQFIELFEILRKDVSKSHQILDEYIRDKNKKILQSIDIKKLVSELFKRKSFEWGGDYQNSLDKYLISQYVKVIQSYDELLSKFETEINPAVQGYVLNSWYNHWSSILIEHIFKLHPIVLPTVGQIKSVDFFINNIPFDLKVTYFPAEYLKQQRRTKGFPVELTYLKMKARGLNIDFDTTAAASDIYYEIKEKFRDRNDKSTTEALTKLKDENMSIVLESIKNPKELAKWLYENQGEMRFGSENRLYLVLIDAEDFSNSWKLKRNLDLLTPAINSFLDEFTRRSPKDLIIKFQYTGKPQEFTALSDIVFVLK